MSYGLPTAFIRAVPHYLFRYSMNIIIPPGFDMNNFLVQDVII